MKYEHMIESRFLSRPNRFIAHVEVQGEQVTTHVKNTGRYRELLIPGVTVLLQHRPDALEADRKTEYSLIGVYKRDILINVDSQTPNQMAEGWLHTNGFTRGTGTAASNIHREVTHGNSRFDLAFPTDGEQVCMEVKGVTLEANRVAKFPGAPTERDIKHVKELAPASRRRLRTYILFVTQMKGITSFIPNIDTHPVLGEALQEASQAGVHIMTYDCIVTKEELSVDQSIEVPIHKNRIHQTNSKIYPGFHPAACRDRTDPCPHVLVSPVPPSLPSKLEPTPDNRYPESLPYLQGSA